MTRATSNTTSLAADSAGPPVSSPDALTTPVPDLVTMLEAGVHFGHERSKKNPKMDPFIYTFRHRIAIIDLAATQAALKKAMVALKHLAARPGSQILLVGTKRQARDIVRRWAEAVGMPYVTKRWLGGTLTNFSTILKSVEKLEELKSVSQSAARQRLTKKEQAVMRKEISRLEAVLEGIKSIRTLPQALIVVGAHDEKIAVSEARRVGVPVFSVTDTNTDPELVDYPIPANDDAVRALDLIVGSLARAIAEGKGISLKDVPTPASAPPPGDIGGQVPK